LPRWAARLLTEPGQRLYRLVWTGTLASQYHDSAGQAVSLTVTTTEAGSQLPHSLRQQRLSVADRPAHHHGYPGRPGGDLQTRPIRAELKLTGATNGETVYVRTTVTDPFGYTDITTVTLEIVDPNGAAQTVALNPPTG
jgi:hypothetical protein